jgi:hypothetical protein
MNLYPFGNALLSHRACLDSIFKSESKKYPADNPQNPLNHYKFPQFAMSKTLAKELTEAA